MIATPSVLKVKWSRYIPSHQMVNGELRQFKPTAKQIAYLSLPHREALFGGAAGGGKSAALLMAALQYFDCPEFSGILFRRKLTDHKLKDSILSLALNWLSPWIESGDVVYRPHEHTLYSREGGMITFGYMDKEGSMQRYMSAQYQLCGYDELTHNKEEEYTFMFSRLRRTNRTMGIPLRMRGATNPGSRGHAWVKKRFGIERDEDGEFRGHSPNRPFIQAKIRDNPYIDAEMYEKNLGEMGEVWKQRMRDGDWSASEAAIFKDDWFAHRWKLKGEYYQLDTGNEIKVYHKSNIFVFTTLDTAGSETTGIEGKVFYTNQDPSWSVCMVWGMTPDYHLILLDVHRTQVHIPRFVDEVVEVHRMWKPSFCISEDNAINLGAVQGLEAKGLTVLKIPSVHSKIVRSTAAQIRAKDGRIWLPAFADWLQDVENEWFVWTGMKGETDDQIDTLSLAGHYASCASVGTDVDSGVSGIVGAVARARGGLWAPTGIHRGLWAGNRR